MLIEFECRIYLCTICEQPWDDCECVAEYFESAELAAMRQEIRYLRNVVKADAAVEFNREAEVFLDRVFGKTNEKGA